MTISEEPPVVELEELLDDQQTPDSVRTGRQVALIVVLSVIGLAAVAVLAVMATPVVAQLLRVVVPWAKLITAALGGELS